MLADLSAFCVFADATSSKAILLASTALPHIILVHHCIPHLLRRILLLQRACLDVVPPPAVSYATVFRKGQRFRFFPLP